MITNKRRRVKLVRARHRADQKVAGGAIGSDHSVAGCDVMDEPPKLTGRHRQNLLPFPVGSVSITTTGNIYVQEIRRLSRQR